MKMKEGAEILQAPMSLPTSPRGRASQRGAGHPAERGSPSRFPPSRQKAVGFWEMANTFCTGDGEAELKSSAK